MASAGVHCCDDTVLEQTFTDTTQCSITYLQQCLLLCHVACSDSCAGLQQHIASLQVTMPAGPHKNKHKHPKASSCPACKCQCTTVLETARSQLCCPNGTSADMGAYVG